MMGYMEMGYYVNGSEGNWSNESNDSWDDKSNMSAELANDSMGDENESNISAHAMNGTQVGNASMDAMTNRSMEMQENASMNSSGESNGSDDDDNESANMSANVSDNSSMVKPARLVLNAMS